MRRALAAIGAVTAIVSFAFGLVALLEAFATFVSVHVHWLSHYLGINSQLTPNYAFPSGSGALMITALGMTTLITGIWTRVNCHEPGCPRIGKHHINGTPWCSRHEKNARPERTVEELLEQVIEILREGK